MTAAVPSRNSALASTGAELHITRNWSLAAKFDAESASRLADLCRHRHPALYMVILDRRAYTSRKATSECGGEGEPDTPWRLWGKSPDGAWGLPYW